MGDHVKVLAGRYEGDTGLIVRVEDNMAVLFSDLTMHEVGEILKVPLVETFFKVNRNHYQTGLPLVNDRCCNTLVLVCASLSISFSS